MSAVAVALGGAGVKLIGGLIGGRKRRKAAEALAEREAKRRDEIRIAGEKNLGEVSNIFKSGFDQLANLESLNIDTTFADQAFSDAKRNSQRQDGRAAGEELARDSIRQSTADSLGRARGSGSSIADLLGFVGDAETRERNSMTNIDIKGIQSRELRIDQAMARLEAAGANRTDFYLNKEMAEFKDERSRALQLADFQQNAGLTIADIKNQNSLDFIQGSDNIASSNAAIQNVRAGNIEAIIGGLGDSLMNFGGSELDLFGKRKEIG